MTKLFNFFKKHYISSLTIFSLLIIAFGYITTYHNNLLYVPSTYISIIVILIIIFECLKFYFGWLKNHKTKYNGIMAQAPIRLLSLLGIVLRDIFTPILVIKAINLAAKQNLLEPSYGAYVVTASFIACGLSSFLLGIFVNKFMTHKLFHSSAALFFIGSIICLLIDNYYIWCLGALLRGIGYGFSNVTLSAFIATEKDLQIKSIAFAEQQNAQASGGTIALGLGVMLLLIGNDYYIIATSIFLSICYFALATTTKNSTSNNATTEEYNSISISKSSQLPNTNKDMKKDINTDIKTDNTKKVSLLDLVKNKTVFYTFIFALLPSSSIIAFNFYYFPYYANLNGLTTSDFGNLMFLVNLLLATLLPISNKFVNKYVQNNCLTITGSIMGIVVGVTIFLLCPNLITICLAAVLVFNLYMVALAKIYTDMTSINICQQYGNNKIISIIILLDFIGIAVGPMIISYAIKFGEISGLWLINIGLFLTTIIYFLSSIKTIKNNENQK